MPLFEHRTQPVLPARAFARRLLVMLGFAIAVAAFSVAFGACGYHWAANQDWPKAFHYACLMLSGHDVEPFASTSVGHAFAGVFAMYARLVFVSLVAFLLAPLLHRILHRLHCEVPGQVD